jgi:arylsulfatase A-like enzyme
VSSPSERPAAPAAEEPTTTAGHVVAWGLLAVINAVFVLATFPRTEPALLRWRHLAFDGGQMVGLGLLCGAALEAWQRWGSRRPRLGVLATFGAALAIGAAVLRRDLDGVAALLPGPSRLWLGVLIALAATAIPLAALAARLARRRVWLAAPAAVLSLGLGLGNELWLPYDYFGLHLFAAWTAATVLGVLLSRWLAPWAAAIAARPKRQRLALGARCLVTVWAATTLVMWPGSRVLVELFKVPGSVIAPYLVYSRRGRAGAVSIAPEAGAWFRDRSKAPDVPPTLPPLLGPNPVVVVFVVDAMRAEVLEHPANAAMLPTMFALQSSAVRFARAHSAAPATTQSVTSLMTSKYYSQLYWTPVRNSIGAERVFAEEDRSRHFPELLSAAGVPTAIATSLTGLNAQLGTARGFAEECIRAKSWTPAADIVDRAVQRIARIGDGPLFLYIQVTDAHAPYRNLPSGAGGSAYEKYLRSLGQIDQGLGRIEAALARPGLAERAVLVLMADHGEAFGEHGDRHHGHTLYEEQLRVPLLFRVPGVRPHVVDELVSLIDLGPTMLDLYGQPIPGSFMGQSLVGLLRGDGQRLARPIAAESSRHKRALLLPSGGKVIEDRRLGTVELFDLSKDPGERQNLYDDASAADCPQLALLREFFDANELTRPGYVLPYQP